MQCAICGKAYKAETTEDFKAYTCRTCRPKAKRVFKHTDVQGSQDETYAGFM